MELAESLCRTRLAGRMGFEQVFGLVLEVLEIGIGRKASYGHMNFLSYAQVRNLRAEREFMELRWECKVDFCPLRGPDAPFALRVG
jgi:hypothetical protein